MEKDKHKINVIAQTRTDINEKGHTQYDNRMKRHTRAVNGHTVVKHYLDPVESKQLQPKYQDDWLRMYHTYVKVCDELDSDKYSRRAVIFNTSKYQENFPCFLAMQILHNENGDYDAIVYQRSSDLEKLQFDIEFFEYVMAKVKRRTGLNVNRLIIHCGSLHYETNE